MFFDSTQNSKLLIQLLTHLPLHRQFFFAFFVFLPDILTFHFTTPDHIILDSLRGLWAINATEYKGWKSNCRCKLCYLWSHLVHCNHLTPKGSKTPKMTLCFINHATFTELSPLAIKWTILYKHASNLIVPLQASKVHSLPQRENWLRDTWKIITKNNNNKLKQNKNHPATIFWLVKNYAYPQDIPVLKEFLTLFECNRSFLRIFSYTIQ